jgi:hypothetical protein
MEMNYRCLKCGNNLLFSSVDDAKCNTCVGPTILALVTEENESILPFPTDPIGRNEVDINDPSSNCQCAPGLCPCGKFVAHLASESWDPDNPHLFGAEAMEWHKKKAAEKE